MTFIEHYPHPYHPIIDGNDGPEPDPTRTVAVFQLRPGDQARLLDWAGGGIALADGGVILTADGTTITGRLALGDFAVRDEAGMSAHPADGFAQRYVPAIGTA